MSGSIEWHAFATRGCAEVCAIEPGGAGGTAAPASRDPSRFAVPCPSRSNWRISSQLSTRQHPVSFQLCGAENNIPAP
jgi:hypothetical protein